MVYLYIGFIWAILMLGLQIQIFGFKLEAYKYFLCFFIHLLFWPCGVIEFLYKQIKK